MKEKYLVRRITKGHHKQFSYCGTHEHGKFSVSGCHENTIEEIIKKIKSEKYLIDKNAYFVDFSSVDYKTAATVAINGPISRDDFPINSIQKIRDYEPRPYIEGEELSSLTEVSTDIILKLYDKAGIKYTLVSEIEVTA